VFSPPQEIDLDRVARDSKICWEVNSPAKASSNIHFLHKF